MVAAAGQSERATGREGGARVSSGRWLAAWQRAVVLQWGGSVFVAWLRDHGVYWGRLSDDHCRRFPWRLRFLLLCCHVQRTAGYHHHEPHCRRYVWSFELSIMMSVYVCLCVCMYVIFIRCNRCTSNNKHKKLSQNDVQYKADKPKTTLLDKAI